MRSLILALSFVVAASACQRGPTPSSQQASSSGANAVRLPIARLVFIDLENANESTRARSEQAWVALGDSLGRPPRMPVARVHLDTEPTKVERFKARDPLLAPPAVAFIDDNGVVLEMIQGEITAEKISAVLERQ